MGYSQYTVVAVKTKEDGLRLVNLINSGWMVLYTSPDSGATVYTLRKKEDEVE
jgi:uncharacterized protein (UPF0218 family)